MSKLSENTTALSIRSSSRCGDRGLRMLGFHFTQEAKVLATKDMSPGVLDKLLNHVELHVEQIERAPYEKPAARTIAVVAPTLPGTDDEPTAVEGIKRRKKSKSKRKTG